VTHELHRGTWRSGPLHPVQCRYLAEDLVRSRRAGEQRRYAAPQRAAKIDPNPHQVEAVIFALERLREGGCILADEVGLGKTIEAGLVVAQLLAEGARRILLIAPKPLLGQWRLELYQLFGLDAHEGQPRVGGFDGAGVFLIGREAAGSERGRDALLASEPFDLCIVDEAHEVFAAIHKRFDQYGHYQQDAPHARTAGRLREVLSAGRTPVLLLTATPIQNSLAELWGLVHFVDPLGTLLGDLPTFRAVFCGGDDRRLAPGQEEELRGRLRAVLQRTLRRQAQDFLEKPFVHRQAKLFEYAMSPDERSLYDDVTRYLLEPGIVAFSGNQRQLLLLGFHRLMASSTRALALSLSRVAARLRRILVAEGTDEGSSEDVQTFANDLEDPELSEPVEAVASSADVAALAGHNPHAIRAELARIERYVERAEALGNDDSKFRALVRAFTFVSDRAKQGLGAGKMVVFTESLVTQEYLQTRLLESRLLCDEEVTLFRGTNDSVRAKQALARWREQTPQGEGAKPSPENAVRLALVHEFKTSSKVFISTEAGAKGLNLQFCDTVVNYDLPWNPQRIEQRIGRCHRYGQQHDVTVINFLASDNEAQRLTLEILSQKLELFGSVLSASDQVLHGAGDVGGGVLASAIGAEFEAELRRIYDRARTLEEVTAELRALREKMGEARQRFEETQGRTASVIEQRFDKRVQDVFRSRKDALPGALAELDADLVTLVTSYLDANAIRSSRRVEDGVELLCVDPSPALPGELATGVTAAIGSSTAHTSLHLNHPLVAAAIAQARSVEASPAARVKVPHDAPAELRRLVGQRARMRIVKVAFDGFERVELLVTVVVLADGEVLSPATAHSLLQEVITEDEDLVARSSEVSDDVADDAVEEVLFAVQASVDDAEQDRFEQAARQAERFIEDRLLILKRRRSVVLERLAEAQRRQAGAASSEARTDAEHAVLKAQTALEELDGSIARLDVREDETFKTYTEHIQRRRYAPPQTQKMFELELHFV
jgi:hypothetical protein